MKNDDWLEVLSKDRAGAVIIKDNKILLFHRFKNGREYWCLPGGGIEEGEINESALDREIKEELNLTVLDKKFLFSIPNRGINEYQYLVTKYSGTSKLGGIEAEIMNENNQYIITWVPINKFFQLDDFLPRKTRDILSSMWNRSEIQEMLNRKL
jgi:8-oxo-dGTP diphosphatase